MKLKQATHCNVERILTITDSAREFQRSLGFVQWEDDYPSRSIIENDIAESTGYVLENNGLIIAYVVLAVSDADYDTLHGVWRFDEPYGVVHRIAIAPEMRGQHVSDILFPMIEKEYLSRNIGVVRMDTGNQNIVMQRLLDKFGYDNLGLHRFSWGERLAFEKKLK